MLTITVVVLAMAVLVPATSLAASAQKDAYEGQLLQIRYSEVSAHVDFVTGVLSDTVSLVPQASDLNAWTSKLSADLSTLQGYANSQDRDGFNNYAKDTVSADIKSALNALQADRQQYKAWNVTAATRKQLLSDYQARKADYESQLNQIEIQEGQARLSEYNTDIAAADSMIANLSAKGIDTSAMQSIVAGAEANVVTPLQNAVNEGDVNATKDVLKSTCMYNGAAYSYHLAAQLDLARLQAITAKISANATNDGYGSQIADINAKLSSAQTMLGQIGTSPYSGDQESQYYGILNSASDEIKTVMKEMKNKVTTDSAATSSA